MAKIKIYPYNLLENNTVTVTGTPDSGFAEERLWDRSTAFYWKRTATETIEVVIDQGSDNLPIDFLGIERHNFNGRTMNWQYSANGSGWADAVTSWAQADNNQIIKTLAAPLSYRYWKLIIASAVNPQCTEIFMSAGYEFQARLDERPRTRDEDNVIWQDSVGGMEYSIKMGEARNIWEYSIYAEPTSKANLATVLSYLDDYAFPFYLKDHQLVYKFARFASTPDKEWVTDQTFFTTLAFKEMLG